MAVPVEDLDDDELKEVCEKLIDAVENEKSDDESDWTTLSDRSGSEVENPCCACAEGEEHEPDRGESKSKLREEKKKTPEPLQAPDLEPQEDAVPPPKKPGATQLKINPKNYAPPNKGERAQPSTLYAHSDEDSDVEGQPKQQFSEETIKNYRERYRLKRPPKKEEQNVVTVKSRKKSKTD